VCVCVLRGGRSESLLKRERAAEVVSFLSVAQAGKEERNEVGHAGRITKKKSGCDEQQVNVPRQPAPSPPVHPSIQECRTESWPIGVHRTS
jgi:hypothetical protein